MTPTRAILAACALLSASALAPAPTRTLSACADRRGVLGGVAAAGLAAFAPLVAVADEGAAQFEAPPAPAPKPEPVAFPTDWGITSDYYTDAAKVVAHMRIATNLDKGAPDMELIAKNTKKEMIEFVSFYRRFTNVAGKQSFSTLYTAINVLAGHYTSYGPKFPVPEKRRKRLSQEYAEIEKNIKKRR